MNSTRRVTQRAPLSCLPCSKRKMKCSRHLPCTNCVRRKIPDQCTRESVILSKRISNKKPNLQPDGHQNPVTNGRTLPNGSSTPVIPPLANDASPSRYSSREETPTVPLVQVNILAHNKRGEVQLAMEAANNLESLAWGSHEATSEVHLDRNRAAGMQGSLSDLQERAVLEFHQNHVAWTHNVLHMPTFIRECMGFHQTRALPNVGWLSLYYAVLSLSFLYMSDERAVAIGLPESHLLCQSFYDLTMETLHAAEFATTNTSLNPITICMIFSLLTSNISIRYTSSLHNLTMLPCIRVFAPSVPELFLADHDSDPKRIMVLLSMATCMAQIMQIHRLRPESTPQSVSDLILQEVKKRVWCFLCIQDFYLITFKKSYSIVMDHCSTPPPTHCDEDETRISSKGFATTLPLSSATQSSYQLLQLRLANFSRTLFDKMTVLQEAENGLSQMFDCVLQADEQLVQLAHGLPTWLGSNATHDISPTEAPFAGSVRRAFRITFSHLRMQIHRSFFCRGTTDKRFHYSFLSCLEAARIIMKEYLLPCPSAEIECWTIPAHVMSACKIIILKRLFTRGSSDLVNSDQSADAHDHDVMQKCLSRLQMSPHTNKIVERGIMMINKLTEEFCDPQSPYTDLNYEETSRLVEEVEAQVSNFRLNDMSIISGNDDILGMMDFPELGE